MSFPSTVTDKIYNPPSHDGKSHSDDGFTKTRGAQLGSKNSRFNNLLIPLLHKQSSRTQVLSQAALLKKPFEAAIVLGIAAVYKAKVELLSSATLTGFMMTYNEVEISSKLAKGCMIGLCVVIAHIAGQVFLAGLLIKKHRQKLATDDPTLELKS